MHIVESVEAYRHPYGGRNYEYQSEDPYLAEVIAAVTIVGIQAQGIQAVAKHDVGNHRKPCGRPRSP
jgi:beta-glucosidase